MREARRPYCPRRQEETLRRNRYSLNAAAKQVRGPVRGQPWTRPRGVPGPLSRGAIGGVIEEVQGGWEERRCRLGGLEKGTDRAGKGGPGAQGKLVIVFNYCSFIESWETWQHGGVLTGHSQEDGAVGDTGEQQLWWTPREAGGVGSGITGHLIWRDERGGRCGHRCR